MENKDEFRMVEIDLENDEFLDYVLVQMAKQGIGVDKEAIIAMMDIVDDYILLKIEGEDIE